MAIAYRRRGSAGHLPGCVVDRGCRCPEAKPSSVQFRPLADNGPQCLKAIGTERALRAAAESMVVALARSGDDAAFNELVRRRGAFVRQLLRRLCRDGSLADDLSQQTFLHAWRSIAQLRSAAAFSGWLRQVAVNCWLQHLRRSTTRLIQTEEGLGEPTVATSPSEQLDLDGALARLAPAVRPCVVLAYHEGLSHSEIGSLMAIPLGTVKSNITRGALQLKEFLKEYR